MQFLIATMFHYFKIFYSKQQRTVQMFFEIICPYLELNKIFQNTNIKQYVHCSTIVDSSTISFVT